VGLGRGGKIPPSGAREGEISREYGCFYVGKSSINRGFWKKKSHI
jgi:hypothetical protein